MNPAPIFTFIVYCAILAPVGWLVLRMLKKWAPAGYFDLVASPIVNLSSFLPASIQDHIGREDNQQPLVAPPGIDLPPEVPYTTYGFGLHGISKTPRSCSGFRFDLRGSMIGSNGPLWIALMALLLSFAANGGWVSWFANFVSIAAMVTMLMEWMPYLVPVTVGVVAVWVGWMKVLSGGFNPSIGWIATGVAVGLVLPVLVNWIYLWPVVGRWIGQDGSCLPTHDQLEGDELAHCSNYMKWMVSVPWYCLAGPLAIYPVARAMVSLCRLLFAFRRHGIPISEIVWFGTNYIFFGSYVAGTSFVRWFNRWHWGVFYTILFYVAMILTVIGGVLLLIGLKSLGNTGKTSFGLGGSK